MRRKALLYVSTGKFLLLSFGTGLPKFGIGPAPDFFSPSTSLRRALRLERFAFQ